MQPENKAPKTFARLLDANARKAMDRLAVLMENDDQLETARKACVDVLKFYAERPHRKKIATPTAAQEPPDDDTADRLLRELTGD